MAQRHTVVSSAEAVASETGALFTTALQAESLGAPETGGWLVLLRQGWHQGTLHHAHCCLWTPRLIAKALMSNRTAQVGLSAISASE